MLTFATLLLTPILMIWLSLSIFQKNQVTTIKDLYHSDNLWELVAGNSVESLEGATFDLQDEILDIIDEDPDRLIQEETLQELENRVKVLEGGLVLFRDSEVIHDGYPAEETSNLQEMLRDAASLTSFSDGGTFLAGSLQCYVKQQDFLFSDNSAGRIDILIPADAQFPETRGFLTQMLVSVAALLIVIAFSMTLWIYYTMLRPITELQKATQAIRDGNLDYQLYLDDTDEIGDLCRDFEAMRRRLKETAEEKVQYDKESKELISNISHDLKTPITTIKGYSQGLMEGVASSPEKQERYVRTIYNKACDMERLIEELTFYSKIDTNKMPYSFSKINVADYFNDCVMDLSNELEARNIEFRYRNRVDDDTLIIADAEQMKRVVNNVISNSVKYMDKPKQFIHMDIRDAGDFIEVTIEDNGKGIGAKDLPRIFERFYRTDASRSSSTGGSGIGLSIVKKIIEDHGGKVWATSVEGEGTTIHFVLRKYVETEAGGSGLSGGRFS